MKLWVDDERKPPQGWSFTHEASTALWLLLGGQYGDNKVEELSLDHDLGQDHPTGYDLLYCMARMKLKVPKIAVHSANPVGAEAMRNLIDQMELEA